MRWRLWMLAAAIGRTVTWCLETLANAAADVTSHCAWKARSSRRGPGSLA